MILPQQADYVAGAHVVLVDFPAALEASATADASGTATATFDPVDQDMFWRVERLTTVTDQAVPAGAQLLIYEGPTVAPIRVRDGSSAPQLDVADEASPITIHPNCALIAQWTGLTPGTTASISVQYQLWRRIIRSV